MTVSLQIIDGMTSSLEQVSTVGKLEGAQRLDVAACVDDLSVSIDECIDGFLASKEVPYKSLARFLNRCKDMKRLLGDDLDEQTTKELRSALIHSQMFDKDLETSLEQFEPKLLKVFLLGPPINWLFGARRAIAKLRDANDRLKGAATKLKA